jgi:hypothetical protein
MDRERLRRWIALRQFNLDDWLVDRWNGNLPGWVYSTDGGWGTVFCWLLGHNPIPDHCGNPKHDHCAWCNNRTPGQARHG